MESIWVKKDARFFSISPLEHGRAALKEKDPETIKSVNGTQLESNSNRLAPEFRTSVRQSVTHLFLIHDVLKC